MGYVLQSGNDRNKVGSRLLRSCSADGQLVAASALWCVQLMFWSLFQRVPERRPRRWNAVLRPLVGWPMGRSPDRDFAVTELCSERREGRTATIKGAGGGRLAMELAA